MLYGKTLLGLFCTIWVVLGAYSVSVFYHDITVRCLSLQDTTKSKKSPYRAFCVAYVIDSCEKSLFGIQNLNI